MPFFANLERSARAIRPSEALTKEDVTVCATLAQYADDAAPVVETHIARNEKEAKELIVALNATAGQSAAEALDGDPNAHTAS